MAEGRYWPKGYWAEGYWSEGYWPDGEEVIQAPAEDDAGAGWWYFKDFRESLGFKDPPLPTVVIPPVQGFLKASIGSLGVKAQGRALNPARPLTRPVQPGVRLPVQGRVTARLPALATIGAGRAEVVSTGAGVVSLRSIGIAGRGDVEVQGKANIPVGMGLRLRARADYSVCNEEEMLALVAAARVQFEHLDVTDDELLLLVSVAAQQLGWVQPPGDRDVGGP